MRCGSLTLTLDCFLLCSVIYGAWTMHMMPVPHFEINASSVSVTSAVFNRIGNKSPWIRHMFGERSIFRQWDVSKGDWTFLTLKEYNSSFWFPAAMHVDEGHSSKRCSIDMLGFAETVSSNARNQSRSPLYSQRIAKMPAFTRVVGKAVLTSYEQHAPTKGMHWTCFYRVRDAIYDVPRAYSMMLFHCIAPTNDASCRHLSLLSDRNEDGGADDTHEYVKVNSNILLKLLTYHSTGYFVSNVSLHLPVRSSLPRDHSSSVSPTSSTTTPASSSSSSPGISTNNASSSSNAATNKTSTSSAQYHMVVCGVVPYTSQSEGIRQQNGAMMYEWIRYYTKLGFRILLYDNNGVHWPYIFNTNYSERQDEASTMAAVRNVFSGESNSSKYMHRYDHTINTSSDSSSSSKSGNGVDNRTVSEFATPLFEYYNYTIYGLLSDQFNQTEYQALYLAHQRNRRSKQQAAAASAHTSAVGSMSLSVKQESRFHFDQTPDVGVSRDAIDLDKILTITHCRFEAMRRFSGAGNYVWVLVVDFDEFLFCPEGTTQAKKQREFIQTLIKQHSNSRSSSSSNPLRKDGRRHFPAGQGGQGMPDAETVDQVSFPMRTVLSRSTAEPLRDCLARKVIHGGQEKYSMNMIVNESRGYHDDTSRGFHPPASASESTTTTTRTSSTGSNITGIGKEAGIRDPAGSHSFVTTMPTDTAGRPMHYRSGSIFECWASATSTHRMKKITNVKTMHVSGSCPWTTIHSACSSSFGRKKTDPSRSRMDCQCHTSTAWSRCSILHFNENLRLLRTKKKSKSNSSSISNGTGIHPTTESDILPYGIHEIEQVSRGGG